MAEWHYDLFLVATGSIDPAAVQERLTREFPTLASPSPKLSLWGSLDGDRIDFWTDHSPVQLLVRFDLRSPSSGFRQAILGLAHDFHFDVVNSNDVSMAATDDALLAAIESSAAAEFVRNPPPEDDVVGEEN